MLALLKREEFAISLRQSKRKDVLSLKRRRNIEYYVKGAAIDDVDLRLHMKKLFENFNFKIIK
jgi:hypothetical protein